MPARGPHPEQPVQLRPGDSEVARRRSHAAVEALEELLEVVLADDQRLELGWDGGQRAADTLRDRPQHVGRDHKSR